MSDNIPFEIQVEIMKLLPVKSLIQFRSVSKTWKSMIDSSGFVAEYSRQHTHMQHILVRYEAVTDFEITYVSIVDDDTFPTRRVSLPRPNMHGAHIVVGYSHGVFCLYQFGQYDGRVRGAGKAVLWNPSIRKTIDVVLPNMAAGKTYETVLGFGVCRETNDMKIVKINHIVSWSDVESASCIPWQVQVFTLSTRTWRSLGGNLPRKLVCFHFVTRSVVAIDGVIYWLVTDRVTSCNLIISFDITSEGFGEINLPNGLARPPLGHWLFMFKLRGSLVLVDHAYRANVLAYDVWLMEGGVPKSFTKLSTFNPNMHVPDAAMPLGFRKSGEHIIGNSEHALDAMPRGYLLVYDPHSKRINSIGIEGLLFSFFVHPYMETLFLLDQPNRTVHN